MSASCCRARYATALWVEVGRPKKSTNIPRGPAFWSVFGAIVLATALLPTFVNAFAITNLTYFLVWVFMALGLSLMGLTYGPLGTVLSELFPTPVRYTGSSLSFNFAGILGASLAPYIATWLAKNYGLQYVGYYLTASAALTFIGLLMIRETKDEDLAGSRV